MAVVEEGHERGVREGRTMVEVDRNGESRKSI